MVYCTKCGAKNEEDAVACVKCGAPLYKPTRVSRPPEVEEACLGVPWPWLLPFIGVMIILAGIFWLLEQFVPRMPSLWPLVLIAFGVLVILAALYRPKR